jgi:hypothetical protein
VEPNAYRPLEAELWIRDYKKSEDFAGQPDKYFVPARAKPTRKLKTAADSLRKLNSDDGNQGEIVMKPLRVNDFKGNAFAPSFRNPDLTPMDIALAGKDLRTWTRLGLPLFRKLAIVEYHS